jgi:hypothetical protein
VGQIQRTKACVSIVPRCTSIVPPKVQTSNVPATTLIDDNIKSLSRRNNGDGSAEFLEGLHNLRSNGLNSKGYFLRFSCNPCSSIFLLSLVGSYLHDDSFKQHKLKDSDYTIKIIKGYLDACNLTDFTPAISAISEHKPLVKTHLFDACWLYIQTHTIWNYWKASAIEYLDTILLLWRNCQLRDYSTTKDICFEI